MSLEPVFDKTTNEQLGILYASSAIHPFRGVNRIWLNKMLQFLNFVCSSQKMCLAPAQALVILHVPLLVCTTKGKHLEHRLQ